MPQWKVIDSHGNMHTLNANVVQLEEGYVIFKASNGSRPTHMFYRPISVEEL